jgi:hypothetical protein
MEMPHANARAAIAIAVTEVVGVLVMVEAFLESALMLAQLYAYTRSRRNAGTLTGRVSFTLLLHSRHGAPSRRNTRGMRHPYCFLSMASRIAGSMSQYSHGLALKGVYL